ncbi:MAG: molybdate ABC transporter permease subunit [Alphaproteobacteria bacterium]|nr:molybdate ABC transporter permease subunit [Alphaproteobacteria bacterium]
MNWQALWLTAKLASVVALLLLVVGMPIAYWIAFSRARWRPLVESLVGLPLVLPPTVIGFYALLFFGETTASGRALRHVFGHGLAFTFEGLVIASLVYSLPFAVQPFAAGFAAVDRNLLDVAATLGAGPWRRFCEIVLPLSRGAVITGLALSFAHTVGEFGVVLMVGGNIPGRTRTVSVDIYDRVQQFDFKGAEQTSLLLLAFSFVLLTAIYGVTGRRWNLGLRR